MAAPQNYNPSTTDIKCTQIKTSSNTEFGKFDAKSSKCRNCAKKESCLYYNYINNNSNKPVEFSKKLTNINIIVYLTVLSLSLIGWFIRGSAPVEILTAATSAYSLIMLFYFGKSGSENVTKIKNSYSCYVEAMPDNILSGNSALTNVALSDRYYGDDEIIEEEDDILSLMNTLESEEDIDNVDIGLLSKLMQAELSNADPIVIDNNDNNDDSEYDNTKYSKLTGY